RRGPPLEFYLAGNGRACREKDAARRLRHAADHAGSCVTVGRGCRARLRPGGNPVRNRYPAAAGGGRLMIKAAGGAPTALAGRHILIVEDEMLIAFALSDMVTELGCTSVLAARVAKAIALAMSQPFDAA